MEPQSFQIGAPELSKWSPGPLKRGPGLPKWLQVGPNSIGMVDWRSSGIPREPRRLLGSGLGRPGTAKIAAKEPQGSPKASQNGTNMGSIWGLKPVQNGIRFGVLKNVDF